MNPQAKSKKLLMTIPYFQEGLLFLENLKHTYPNCFKASGYEKPLKKNIFEDLFAHWLGDDIERTATLVQSALRIYTSSLTYRCSLIRPDSFRIDLDGKILEPVTHEERIHAKYRALDLNWKIEKDERPLVNELKAIDRDYRQKKYLQRMEKMKSHGKPKPKAEVK